MAAAMGAGSLIDAFGQARGQQQANKQNENLAQQEREWNEKMWGKTNEYNLNHWHRINKYNSPIEQMARLKEAGLNPHLLYGQGVAGASGEAASVGSANDVKGYNRAEARNIMEGVRAFGDSVRNVAVGAQISNVEANTKKQQAEENSIIEDVASKARGNRQGDELYDENLQDAKDRLKQNKNNRRFELEQQKEFRRQWNRNSKSFKKQMQKLDKEISNLNSQKDLADAKKHYQDIVNRFLDDGVNINDPAWQRQLQLWFPQIKNFVTEIPGMMGNINAGINPLK